MARKVVNPELHTFRSPRLESIILEAISFFTRTPLHSLPPASVFVGVGVYAGRLSTDRASMDTAQ